MYYYLHADIYVSHELAITPLSSSRVSFLPKYLSPTFACNLLRTHTINIIIIDQGQSIVTQLH